jgi:hypothetical protein
VEDLVKVLWEILTREQLDAQSINNLVISMVDIIYGFAECLSLQQVMKMGILRGLWLQLSLFFGNCCLRLMNLCEHLAGRPQIHSPRTILLMYSQRSATYCNLPIKGLA